MHGCRTMLLGLMILAGTLASGRAQAVKDLPKAVLDLAVESEAGKDVSAKTAALKKKFSGVPVVMRLYNARSRGGIGFGSRGVRIERRLIDLGETGIDAETLKKESAELKRVAHINLIMAELTRGFAPAKPFLGRGKKEWERDVDALKTGSNDLLKALTENDPKAVQAAAVKINKACNSCHDGDT